MSAWLLPSQHSRASIRRHAAKSGWLLSNWAGSSIPDQTRVLLGAATDSVAPVALTAAASCSGKFGAVEFTMWFAPMALRIASCSALRTNDQFAGRATVPNLLPLLAERWARQRLTALARVEGKITDAKPTVLFLCTHNAGRSQMALGFFNHLAGDQGVAWSGGSEPGTEINPAAIEAMAEVGIDITGEFPKPWTDEIVQAADVVIAMGCGDACPVFPGRRYEEWLLPDPAGQSVDAVRPIRDDIEERVRRLLTELNITPN